MVTLTEPTLPSRYLLRDDLAGLLSLKPGTIAKYEREGLLPAPIRIGRRSYWSPDVIRAFLAARARHPEPEASSR